MTGFSEKAILIDGKGHLLGRLAALIAKTILNGDKVIVVRTEQINISGNFFRSKLKYLSFLRKRCNVNPARGPFHFRAPSAVLYRTIRGKDSYDVAKSYRPISLTSFLVKTMEKVLDRHLRDTVLSDRPLHRNQHAYQKGMIPHKTKRGKEALKRFKAFEGCPPPYDRRKRLVVPTAMRVMCLKPGRAFCHLGRLSDEVGWKYKDVVRALETKRKVKAVFSIRKRNSLKKMTKAAGAKVQKQTKHFDSIIKSYGYR